jgi:hypothetical protein
MLRTVTSREALGPRSFWMLGDFINGFWHKAPSYWPRTIRFDSETSVTDPMTCRPSKYLLPPSMPGAQPFPSNGPLRKKLNSSIAKIRRSSAPFLLRPVYGYIMTSVENRGGSLFQAGTAPNFQGDRITLCTCKHKDRCSPPPIGKRGPCLLEPWWGVWVAGLCSRTQCQPRALFYLMLVNGSYESPAAIWNALSAPAVKLSRRVRLKQQQAPDHLDDQPADPGRTHFGN